MRQILWAATALVAFATAAAAADNVVIEPGAAAYNWSGVYVGGAIGYNELSLQDLDFEDDYHSGSGFAGAVYAGYNHQVGNVVLGVEADLKYSSADVSIDDAYIPYESRWGASFRGRAGYAVGSIMPYVTAGLAIANFRGDHEGNGEDIATETVSGYVVGGGVEWGATQNIVVRAEYLYSDYGANEFEFPINDIHDVDMRTHDFRLGVAYKF
ncbi:porin family protein [Mesorhizobium sp. CC13]|uniref:outer membrane protein n=1 Tax=Mesorhizobium sp. CC13 TaxID=3029194 RepID=UPI0032658790